MKHTNVLVTGANRGIGRALVEALLERGAAKIHAAARNAKSLEPVIALAPNRIVPHVMDITDSAQVERAAREAGDVSLVINNAGVLASFGVLDASLEELRRDVDTNYFGLLNVARSFAPILERNRGALVSVLSVAALASMPGLGGYSASKAAAFSLTQALRANLGAKNVTVHAVFPGPVDTDMIRGFDLPKTSPRIVATSILDGVEAGTLDILPDPMSKDTHRAWAADPRAVERQFAAM